ncbi:MAG: hypothetical protein NXH75_00155 [Halobacteriovoraceae bacterium]|nr:hypothetical protein [Halobacteriovoraceae bacterium]
MNLRDELYKKFGRNFTSSFSNKGTLVFPLEFDFPLDNEGTVLYQDFFFQLKEDFRFHIFLDLSFYEEEGRRYLYHQFLNLDVHFQLQVVVPLGESLFFPSLNSLWKGAEGLEKEITERYKIAISDGQKTEQRKLSQEMNSPAEEYSIPELPKFEWPVKSTGSLKRKEWFRFGPEGFPFGGKARVDFLLSENRIFDSRIFHGFHFRDFEEKARSKNLESLTLFFERLTVRDSVFAPLLWVETLESHYQIDVTDKAKAVRMVWMELARVECHLNFLWELTHSLGFLVESSIFWELIEQVYHLYNLYSGKVQNFSLFEVGGMKRLAPLGWGTETLETAKYLHKVIEDIEGDLMRNPRFMESTKGFPMSAIKALDYGITGPNLRACGVNFDVRKTQPSYFYDDVDFEVPLGIDGTTYDRFLVRLEELKQSLRIINQVLDHLPAGAINQPELDKLTPEAMESFTTIECSEGLLGLFIKSNQQGEITHLHIRSASLAHFESFPELIQGGFIDGAFTAFQSLNLDAWEMDR